MNQEEGIKRNGFRGIVHKVQIKSNGSRGRDQEKQIKKNGSRRTNQKEWIKRNGSRGMNEKKGSRIIDKEERMERLAKIFKLHDPTLCIIVWTPAKMCV